MTPNPPPAPKLDISTRIRQGVISGRVLTVLVVSLALAVTVMGIAFVAS